MYERKLLYRKKYWITGVTSQFYVQLPEKGFSKEYSSGFTMFALFCITKSRVFQGFEQKNTQLSTEKKLITSTTLILCLKTKQYQK